MSLLDEVRIVEAYERMLIREELDEIFKLKPEAAKEAAKKKMKQISDEIKKAIEKHGEDSKVVQYLRAKKKNMHQQLAHAMGESVSEEEMDCPEGQQWCPVQKKCVEPGRVQARVGLGHGRASGKLAEEECPDGQVWDEAQEKCVEPEEDLEMADEGLAIPKGATVETIANFLQKEFGISKARAMKQAKEYKKKGKEKGFHHFESEELSEAQFKKKYGGKNLKYRFHYGMDLSELINLVKHMAFENITRKGLVADPRNQTQYNNIFTSVLGEVQMQLKMREEVAIKEIKKILPEIVTDALTFPEVK